MIPFEHFQNEMAINEVQPPHSRQRKTEYMDLKEVPTSGSKRNEAPGTLQVERSSLGADYAPLHPTTRSWEIPRSNVTIEKVIGKGAFGQVAKGTAVDLRGRPGNTSVAVKTLKGNPYLIMLNKCFFPPRIHVELNIVKF